MLTLSLDRNGKVAQLNIPEEPVAEGVPCLSIYIADSPYDFDIPLDTLRGKLNELEMMTNPRIKLP